MKTVFLKIISLVLVAVSVLALGVSGYGLKDVMDEKASKEAEKAEKVEQLEAYKEGLAALEKNRKAYEEGKKAYEEGLKQYEEGKASLAAGESQYAQGYNLLAVKNREFLDGKATLEQSKQKLDAGEKAYSEGLSKYNAGKTALDAKTSAYQNAKALVTNAGATALYNKAKPLVETFNSETATDEEKNTAKTNMAPIDATISGAGLPGISNCFQLVGIYNAALAGVKDYEDGKAALETADKELKTNRAKLDAGWEQYKAGEAKLADGQVQLAQGQNRLAAAAAEIEAGKEKLAAAEKELEAGKAKLAEFEAGEKKLKAAENEMKKNEEIKKNLEENPQLSIAEAFQKALDDATAETTKELTTRAVILGAVGVAAVLLFASGVMGLLSKPICIVALIGAVLGGFALGYSFTGEWGISTLQMAAAAAAVSGVAYFATVRLSKAPAKAE